LKKRKKISRPRKINVTLGRIPLIGSKKEGRKVEKKPTAGKTLGTNTPEERNKCHASS